MTPARAPAAPKRYRPAVVRELIHKAALRHGLEPAMVTWKCQERHFVAARTEVMLALKDMGWSLTRIGKAMGGMHHTTVLHGLTKAAGNRAAGSAADKPFDWTVKVPDDSGAWAI